MLQQKNSMGANDANPTGCPKKMHPRFLNNFSGYKHARWLRHISFEKWDLQLRLEYKNILYDIRELRYKEIKIGYRNQKFQILVDLMPLNLMPHIVLFMFQFPYVVQKSGLYLKHTEGRMYPLLLYCSQLENIPIKVDCC